MKRRQLAAGLAALAATAIPGRPRAQTTKPFRIAVSAPVASILPVWLARAGGFYAKQGLDGQIISTEGGSRGIQVLLSGEVQAMHVGLSPVVAANAQGADLRAITSTTNTLPIVLFSREKMDPPLPPGTTVGISTLGSETDVALTVALDAMKLDRKSLRITQIGGTSQRLAAMEVGRIQAAPMLEPGTTAARLKNYAVVYDLAAAKTPWIFDAVVMTRSYIHDHPDDVQAYLRAYVEGGYWGLANPQDARKVIADTFKTRDQEVVDATYEQFRSLLPLDVRPSAAGAANVIAQMSKTGVQLPSTDVADYVDFGPLDELTRTGFFDQMHATYKIS